MVATYLETFNCFSSAAEVREWINQNRNRLRILDEWPRGEGALYSLTCAMRDCRFGSELKLDIQKLNEGWQKGEMPSLSL